MMYVVVLNLCLKVFTEFGEIESLVILKSKDVTRSQGCGFVRFKSVSDASRAIRELNAKLVIDPVCILSISFVLYAYFRLLAPLTLNMLQEKLID